MAQMKRGSNVLGADCSVINMKTEKCALSRKILYLITPHE